MSASDYAPREAGDTRRARGVPSRRAVNADAPGEVTPPRRRSAGQAVVWSSDLDMRPRALSPRTTPEATLTIRRADEQDRITLHLSGTLDMASLLRLRDEAFAAVGAKPKMLCVDMYLISRIEFAGINTLVTIGRVARLAKIHFRVRASATFAQMLRETGLVQTLTLEEAPAPLKNTLSANEA